MKRCVRGNSFSALGRASRCGVNELRLDGQIASDAVHFAVHLALVICAVGPTRRRFSKPPPLRMPAFPTLAQSDAYEFVNRFGDAIWERLRARGCATREQTVRIS
jgi:hypothetical protein